MPRAPRPLSTRARVAGALVAIVAGALCAAWARSPIDPVAVHLPPAAALPVPVDEALDRATLVAVPGAPGVAAPCGPEDVAFDDDGRLYTGCADGRVLRAERPADGRFVEVANTGGRPFGLAFAPSGALLVADGKRGLLAIDGGAVRVLATQADGVPLRFTDELAVDDAGVVYFTDASHRWGIEGYDLDIVEGRGNGRLLRYDPATGAVAVLARDLAFANGVALAADGSYVLVNETARHRVLKHQLTGPGAGATRTLLDRLPGFPDNLARTQRGTYWIGFHSPRKALLDAVHPWPFVKRALMGIPKAIRPKPARGGLVVEIDGDGRVLRALADSDASTVPHPTTAIERDGVLWLGSLIGAHIGRLTLETR